LLSFAINLRRSTQLPTGLKSRLLLEAPGEKMHPALSADGKNVAFVWDGGRPDGNYDIYVMGTASQDKGKAPRRITSDPANDLRPAWSPDGSRLAFLRVTPDKVQLLLFMISDNQELPMVVLDPKGWYNFSTDPLMRGVHPGPEWSADGAAVFVTDARNADSGVPLWRVDIATSERDQLTHPGEFRVDGYPRRVISGSDLIFLRRSGAHVAEALRVETDMGREKQLTEFWRDLRGALLLPNGRDLILSSDESSHHQILYLSLRTGAVPVDVSGTYNFEPSYDGKSLIWATVKSASSLWELPLQNGEPVEGQSVIRRLPAPQGRNHSPAFSPDGRNLTWVSDAAGTWELWTAAQPGGQPRQLSRLSNQLGARFVASPAYSLDGRSIAFEARPSGPAAVMLADPSAAAARAMEENWHEEERPTWSNDGKWIYFSSDRNNVRQIWRRQSAGGQSVRVTSSEASHAQESFDGKTLYFVPANESKGVWAMNSSGGQEAVLPGTETAVIRGHWAVGPLGIYFMGYENEPRTLYYYRFESRTVRPVLRLPKILPPDVQAMAVDRAGTRLVLVQQDEQHSEVMVGQR